MSFTESMHGNVRGAFAALPSASFTSPDPACDLDVIPTQSRLQLFDDAVPNAFAPGSTPRSCFGEEPLRMKQTHEPGQAPTSRKRLDP